VTSSSAYATASAKRSPKTVRAASAYSGGGNDAGTGDTAEPAGNEDALDAGAEDATEAAPGGDKGEREGDDEDELAEDDEDADAGTDDGGEPEDGEEDVEARRGSAPEFGVRRGTETGERRDDEDESE
jgi:hypothetical protein